MSEVEYSVVDLGAVTAYAQAVENGFEGTLEQWAQLQINSANNYQELFNEIYTKDSSAALWEQGGLSASTGNTASSTTRIRTTDYLPDSVAKITMNTGYYIMVYIYGNDGTFCGIVKNDYDFSGDTQILSVGVNLSYAQSCITGSFDLRGLKNFQRNSNEQSPSELYPYKYKIVAAFGAQGTTAITPTAASNITFYDNNVGHAVDNDLIGVGENEPDSDRAVLWIDNSNADAMQLPEIDDDHVSDVDTWSSQKINSHVSQLTEDVTSLREALFPVVDELGSVFATQNELYLWHEKMKDNPEYTFKFGDIANWRWNTSGVKKFENESGGGYSTAKHPIKYDYTMTVEMLPGAFLRSDSTPLGILIGEVTNGEFVPLYIHGISDDNYESRNKYPMINLAIWKSEAEALNDPYVVFTAMRASGANSLLNNIVVKRKNPEAKKYKEHQLIFIINDNVYNEDSNATTKFVIDHRSGANQIQYYSERDFSKSPINGGWKYIYAHGLPIDVAFYDHRGTQLNETVNNLGEYMYDKKYPTCVKVPEKATSYRLAVYGLLRLPSYTSYLGASIPDYLRKVCALTEANRSVSKNYNIGVAVSNARKMLNFTYDGNIVNTRYLSLNHPYISGFAPKFQGFMYGDVTLNYEMSYYSYLTAMKYPVGYNVFANRVTGRNSHMGFVCTTFISECLGFEYYQGTEWWLQNYADKLERTTKHTKWEPGDIIVMTRYQDNPNLYTHVAMVIDVLNDPETGEFIGLELAECSNIWTLNKTYKWLLGGVQGKWLTEDPNTECGMWKISLPLDNVPKLGTHYRFNIDKELDPLNNPNFDMPPCVSFAGDMRLIGPRPENWQYGLNYQYIYFTGDYQTARLYLDGNLINTINIANLSTVNGYKRFTLSDYSTATGVFTIYCDDYYKPATFLRPVYPTITASNDQKVVTVTGATPVYESGVLKAIKTESFDEIWLWVVPYPVASIDGFPNGLPYANYLTVKGTELWDNENQRFDVGNNYQCITRVVCINNTFGASTYKISGLYGPSNNSSSDDDNDDTTIDSNDDPDDDSSFLM